MRTALAVARVQFRILRHDPWFLLIMFGMPVVVIPVFHRVVGLWLEDAGYPGADGSEIVVPGQMVLFGFFLGGSAGFSIFREHGWRTWDRLRASAAAPAALLAGFALPWIIIHVLPSYSWPPRRCAPHNSSMACRTLAPCCSAV